MKKWVIFAFSVILCFGTLLPMAMAASAAMQASMDNSTGIVTVSGNTGSAGENAVTVQVRDPYNHLAYLDQGKSDANGAYLFNFILNRKVVGTYSVSVGGENAGTVAKTTFQVVPPELKADLEPQQPDGQNGWYVHPVNITISALGGLPDDYQIQYRVNQGNWTAYASAFSVESNGTNSVEYRYINDGGNPGPVKSIAFQIDTTAPETTAAASPINGKNGWYVTAPTVTLAAYDNISVAQTQYRVNGSPWIPYTQPVTLSVYGDVYSSGNYNFEYKSVDQAGNEEAIKSLPLKVDTAPPTISVTLDTYSLWPANNKLVTVTAAVYATDSISQIDSIVLTSITSNEPLDAGDIQNAQFGTFDTSFSLRASRSGQGSGRVYTITYTATDKAGNQSAATAKVTVPHDQSGNKQDNNDDDHGQSGHNNGDDHGQSGH